MQRLPSSGRTPFVWLVVAVIGAAVVAAMAYFGARPARRPQTSAGDGSAPSTAGEGLAPTLSASAPSPALEAQSPAVGTQALAVRVVWRDSAQGVAGARVRLSAIVSGAEKAPPPDQAATDAHGEAVLQAPEPWTLAALEVNHDEAARWSKRIPLPSAEPAVAELTRGGTVFGTVWMDNETSPARGAQVELLSANERVGTDQNGSFAFRRLASGQTPILASLGGLVSAAQEQDIPILTVEPGKRTGPLKLVLRPGASLTGVVSDSETKRPLAEARVSATMRLHGGTRQIDPVRTDEAGFYRLEGLLRGQAQASASAEDHVSGSADVALGAAPETRRDFLLRPFSRLFGTVWIEGENKPGAGADVLLFVEGQRPQWQTKADENGAYEIIGVSAAQGRPAAALGSLLSHLSLNEIEPVAISPGMRMGPVDLILRPGLSLTGAVRDGQSGAPLAGAVVRIPIPAIRPRGAEQPSSQALEAMTDGQGRYRFEGLTSEKRWVNASAKGYAPDGVDILMSLTGPTVCNFDLGPGGEVEVRVIETSGAPVAGAHATCEAPRIRGMSARSAETDAAGQAAFPDVDILDPPQFSAWKSGYRPSPQMRPQFAPGQRRAELTLALARAETPSKPEDEKAETSREPGVVAGRVTDPDGGPIAQAQVACCREGAMREAAAVVEADASGWYRVELPGAAAADLWALVAKKDGWAPERKRNIHAGTEASPAHVDFTLGPGHWIEGYVVDAQGESVVGASVWVSVVKRVEGAAVGHEPLAGLDQPMATDAAGHFRLENVPATGVCLDLEAPGRSRVSRKPVPVDEVVRIVMDDKGVIVGRVMDEASRSPISEFTVSLQGGLLRFADARGRFALPNLNLTEEYGVAVEARSYEPMGQKARPSPPDEPQETEFLLVRPRPVAGEARDAATGAPVAGAQAAFVIPQEPRQRPEWRWLEGPVDWRVFALSVQRAATDAQGSFLFHEGQTPGTLFLEAEGYERVLVVPEERPAYMRDGRLRVELKPGGAVQGFCLTQGAPQPRALLSLYREIPSGRGFVQWGDTRADAMGFYRFAGLPEGNCRLVLNGPEELDRRFGLTPGEQKQVNMGEDMGPFALFGRVLDGTRPIPYARVGLGPRFPWAYAAVAVSAGPDGTYRLAGLPAGQYQAWVSEAVDRGRRIDQMVEVAGDTPRDFQFQAASRLVARLIFPSGTPPEIVNRFHTAELRRAAAGGGGSPMPLSSPIMRQRVEFYGRLRGSYTMTLLYEYAQGKTGAMGLAQVLEVDTREAEQDLGGIPVPLLGALRFQIACHPPGAAPPRWLGAYLERVGESRGGSPTPYPPHYSLSPENPDQTIGPLEAGVWTVRLEAPAHRSAPAAQRVTIEPGQTAMVSFLIAAVCEVRARVASGPPPKEEDVAVARVTLVGPNGALTVAPGATSVSLPYGKGTLFGRDTFRFEDLAPGVYELIVEAPGHQTHRATLSVAPGVPTPEGGVIRMNRL